MTSLLVEAGRMVDVAKFRSVATSAGNRDIAFGLTASKNDLSVVSGNAVVRWIRTRKASSNREVSRLFINALKESYGDQIAKQVINATGLASKLENGKPLRTRKVMQALDLAEDTKQRFVTANHRVASNYHRPLEGSDMTPLQLKFNHAVERLLGSDTKGAEMVKARFDPEELNRNFKEEIGYAGKGGKKFVTSEKAGEIAESSVLKQVNQIHHALLMETPLQLKFNHAVERLLGSDTKGAEMVKARFDPEELNRNFKEEIEYAGKGGKKFVTSEKAGKIAESLVWKQVGKIHHALLMEKLDINKKGSLSQKFWSKINPDFATGFSIDLSAKGGIAQEINRQFTDRLADKVYRKVNYIRNPSPELQLKDENLDTIVEKVVGGLARERFAAAQAAKELPIKDVAVKERVVQEILQGKMPASMIPEFCKVYPRLSRNFLELGKSPRPPPEELEKALAEIHDATMGVMRAGNLLPDSKDAVMRSFWQALLAGHDAAQLDGVIEQLGQRGSPLRYFGEGTNYFHHVFTKSDTYSKREDMYESSRDTAINYDFMLNNLAQVCQDKTGAPEPLMGLTSPEMLSDSAVTMLRNLGIKIPAPNRLGEENGDFRLSDQALESVQNSILDQSLRASKKVVDGVGREFSADLGRAVYRLQGADLGTDSGEIMNRLREFCTDESGKLNEAMLLGISKVAYQATFGSLMSILAPGSEHLAPFQSIPNREGGNTGDTGEARPEYDIGKNEKGEVTIRMRFSEPVHQLNGLDPGTGEFSSVRLKPDISRFGMALDVSLDAKTFEPTLNEAGMNYAFYPERYVSEYQTA